MEAELLTKIIASGGGVGAVLYFLNWRVNKFEVEVKKTADRVEVFHREGMEKIERLVEVQHETNVQIALFNQKFYHGEERMGKMETEISALRKSDHDIRNSIHDVKNRMVTQSQIKDILSTKH